MEDPDTMIIQVGEPEEVSETHISRPKLNRDSRSTHEAKLANTQTRQTLAAMLKFSHIIPFSWRASFFSCFFCRKNFSDFISLKEHTVFAHSHSNINEALLAAHIRSPLQRPIKLDVSTIDCKLCKAKINTVDSLKQHLRNEHDQEIELENKGYCTFKLDDGDFACHICGEPFENFFNLMKHANIHFEKYVCEVCGKGFANSNHLRAHRTIHIVGSHECEACGKSFNTELKLRNHFETVHLNRKSAKCPHCGESFRDYGEKRKHMIEVHRETPKKYTCQLCQKDYLRKKSYVRHCKRVHIRLYEVECVVCHKQFYDQRSRREHMDVHKEKLEAFCDVCQKGFVCKKRLRQHIKIHYKTAKTKMRKRPL